MLLYKLFLFLYPKLASILALFNTKARQWKQGQENVWKEIEALKNGIMGPIIWVHAASYGEFEQGLPIIDAIKKKYPHYQIWLSFFSPSGYLYRKNDPSVDFVTYLPLDSAENAAKWMATIDPQLIIFIKYEFWYFYLKAAKDKRIPCLLASAIFRKDQIFFKPYGAFYQKMLSMFTHILVQDSASKELIKHFIPLENITITGDTRFDRVHAILNNKQQFDWLENFDQAPIIIAGSTWPKDHQILSTIAETIPALWIMVPHHVDPSSIKACQKCFPKSICYTTIEKDLIEGSTKLDKTQVLIIDKIGMLRSLYQYATITYVGGGFGKEGIHNVLEPAAFGKPVIWGPNDEKYREAIGLKMAGGGIQIQNEATLKQTCMEILNHAEKAISMGKAASMYTQNNSGATQKTMELIYANRLLIN